MGVPAAIIGSQIIGTGIGLISQNRQRREQREQLEQQAKQQLDQAGEQKRLLEQAPKRITPRESILADPTDRIRRLRSGFGSTLRARQNLGAANVNAPTLSGQRTLLGQ